jgi:Ser/Thr protein kinase RdoA (MazF antagonist)
MTERTVDRPTGPWSAGVGALLTGLAERLPGAAPVPRPAPAPDREVVSYLPGLVPRRPYPPEVRSDRALVSVGRLLRRVHEALAAVEVDGCQRLPGAPTAPAETVCHNDVGPWNVVYRHGEAVALIDWDLAAPGPARWDLALAAWHHVPLYDDADAAHFGWDTAPDRPRRLRLLCDAYGHPVDDALLDDVARWHDVNEAMVTWSRRRPAEPAARPWLKVDLAGVGRDRRWLQINRGRLLGGAATG